MYLQFKFGFVEVDRFYAANVVDMPSLHRAAINAAAHARSPDLKQTENVIVVRSREKSTIVWVSRTTWRRPIVFASPPTWDYEWRTYLSAREWGDVMRTIGESLDYRNFKSWSDHNSTPMRANIAHDVWHVVHDRTERQRTCEIAMSSQNLHVGASMVQSSVGVATRMPTASDDAPRRAASGVVEPGRLANTRKTKRDRRRLDKSRK